MTAESMVHRVVEAMRISLCPEADTVVILFKGETFSLEGLARVAIAEMREPTAEMCVAGTEQWLCEAATEDRSEVNWRAMIDEALR